MASRSKDFNFYHKVSTRIKLIGLDIKFLKTCKQNSIFPDFIKVKINNNCKFSENISLFTKQKWLNSEINYMYYKRSKLEIQAYRLWKSLVLGLTNLEYLN